MTQSPAKKSFFNRNVDLMNGPIFKSLFIFMLPFLVSCLFQQLYNTVDTMIVGNVLGDTALLTGETVVVREAKTGLTGVFWIDADVHTWKNKNYYTKLTLNCRNVMATSNAGSEET